MMCFEHPDPARSVALHHHCLVVGVTVGFAGDAVDHTKQLVWRRWRACIRSGPEAPALELAVVGSCGAVTRSALCATSGCPCGFVRCAACRRFCRCRDRRPTKRHSGRQNRTLRCQGQARMAQADSLSIPGIVEKKLLFEAVEAFPNESVVAHDLLASRGNRAGRQGFADCTGRGRRRELPPAYRVCRRHDATRRSLLATLRRLFRGGCAFR